VNPVAGVQEIKENNKSIITVDVKAAANTSTGG
jgi:hypothetical protein